MSTPTRFPSGITNVSATDPMGRFTYPDPTKLVQFYDDFTGFTNSAAGITGWHLDQVDPAGSDNVPAAISDAHGGIVTITPGAAAGDNLHYQWATNTDVLEPFKLEAGKKAWLKTRFKIEDADQNLILIGLHIAADDPFGTEPSDQFLFRTLASDPDALQFAAGKTNSTEVTGSLGNLADDTWVTVTAHYDGKDTVTVFRETDAGVITNKATVTVTQTTAGDLLPDTEMTVAFGSEAVDTGADVFSIDYIFVAVER